MKWSHDMQALFGLLCLVGLFDQFKQLSSQLHHRHENSSLAAKRRDENGFDGVQAIFGLVKDNRRLRLEDLFGHFQGA